MILYWLYSKLSPDNNGQPIYLFYRYSQDEPTHKMYQKQQLHLSIMWKYGVSKMDSSS